MVRNLTLVGLTLLLVVLMSYSVLAQQIDPNEYLGEFNNAGESCTLQDAFFYTDSLNDLGFVSIYECCKEGICQRIPFDIQNKQELSQTDLWESFNINFARDKIREGSLKPSNYFPESFDVCSYFSDKLPEQSRNLAVEAADNVKKYAPENYQKIYKTMRTAGFATGVISEFEIGIFVVGVGCNKLSKQENEAFFKVAECYNNIQSIESGATHYGISAQTYQCMQEADSMLSTVLNSWWQKRKGDLNKAASVVKGGWNWGKEFFKGNFSAKFEMTETSYETAERIKGKMNIERDYLTNPDGQTLSSHVINRLYEKNTVSQGAYNAIKLNYDELNSKTPGRISEFVSNIFYEPNVDYNESRYYLELSKKDLRKMKDFIKVSKYNSALVLNNTIYSSLENSSIAYELQKQQNRQIDYMPIIVIIIIFGGIVFLVYKKL